MNNSREHGAIVSRDNNGDYPKHPPMKTQKI